jgi:hypothetical protein
MAGPVQTTVTAFWNQLQNVQNQIKAVDAKLQADKAVLQRLYSETRQRLDPMGAHDRAYLDPLIHQNSVLRLSYLAPVKSKFNAAVAASSSVLKSAGYTTPNLSGLGVILPAVIIVPAVAVAALGIAAAAVLIVNRMTQTQVSRTATARSIFSDPGTTPAQKLELAKAFQAEMDAEKKNAPSPLFDTGWIVPAAALVALIVLGPQLLRTFGPRRLEA